MSKNCDVMVVFLIYDQFGASVKLTFSLIVTFHLTKIENRAKKSLTQLSSYCFEGTIFVKKW